MDGANWRPTQGADPAAGVDPNAAAPAGGDWCAHLQPEARSRIVNEIMETLKKHLPLSVPEGLNELQKIAVQFEEEIYTAATNQSDYLRKISQKMFSMEAPKPQGPQQPPGNAQVIPNQNPFGPGSVDSTAQTGHVGAGDWQEEIYQMVKSLNDQYFAELSELYNKISVKLQHIDSMIPPQKPSDQYERMKSFKMMLERTLQFLQINKNDIQPALREKVPLYERQIISILNPHRTKHVQTQVLLRRSVDSTAQTGHVGAGDWQEEIYQMVKSLNDQYFAELSELYNKISVKLQHIDSMIPPQKPSDQYERMTSFKMMLERTLQFLQINKNDIQPALREKVPLYERQIISILNPHRTKHVQTQGQQQFQQSAVQST